MKKGRPAFVLSALVEVHRLAAVEQVYFDETRHSGRTSWGSNAPSSSAPCLPVQTRFGAVPIKNRADRPRTQYKPEFDVRCPRA